MAGSCRTRATADVTGIENDEATRLKAMAALIDIVTELLRDSAKKSKIHETCRVCVG
jgi:hypothetical protein